MARTRRLWISDVIAQGSDRFPAVVLGNRRLKQEGLPLYPSVCVAPNQDPITGEPVAPRLYIGVAYAEDSEMATTVAEATTVGARFRHMEIRASDLTTGFTAAQRNAINPLLTEEGLAAVTAGETKRQVLRRVGRALDVGRDDLVLLRELNAHIRTRPEDIEVG